MVKSKEKVIQNVEIDVDKTNNQYDYTFYSNVARATTSEVDSYIDFMQFPPVENIVPTVRIFLSQKHLKQLFNVLSKLPAISEQNEDE
jgi:hypothetical protein